uniref:RING finger protein 219 n=1 Tax=Phallusia mammillata TaxID=59560 RepID=A0A6F9DQC7_9ASCI|nr:RING finger protein 219 [Phallusia mammillata]
MEVIELELEQTTKSASPNLESTLTPETETASSNEPPSAETKMPQTSDSWFGQKKVLKQALPLILLVALNLIYQYTIYIVLFIALGFVFDRINDFLLQQIVLQDKRSTKRLVIFMLYISVILYLSYPLIKHLWYCNLVNVTGWWKDILPFWEVLFTIAMADFMIKLLTIGVKCCVVIPNSNIARKDKLGGIFVVIESVSQLMRCLVPAPEWVKYIIQTPSLTGFLSLVFAIVYIVMKASAIKGKLLLFKQGWDYCSHPKMLGNPISDGSTPSSVCSLCHEKYQEPEQISCGHVFCHNCCHLWFDRDPHCPMCTSSAVQAIVMGTSQQMPKPHRVTAKSSYWKTGSTEYLVQLF